MGSDDRQRTRTDWTERGLGEPGYTVVELIAWIGEALLDRASRVPGRVWVGLRPATQAGRLTRP